MKRTLAAALLVLGIAVPVAACNGDDSGSSGVAYSGGSGYGGDCSGYTTCGSCTPVEGCGWCFNATSGVCTTDPDQCSSNSEFTWTWDLTGCPGADASVVPLDAGTAPPEASAPEASAPETSVQATDAAAVEAGQ
jgi:Plexin repeat